MTDAQPRDASAHVPCVSVVMPAYNRAGSIRKAVESVLRQTFTDFELLVVDDGSIDGTMDQLADIKDPRLHRLANPHNMGPSAARNTGIRAARGTWVAFQDSDDEWLPLRLEKQMPRLAAAPEDVIAGYCAMIVVRKQAETRTTPLYIPNPKFTTVAGDIRRVLLQVSLVSTQTLIARRAVLAKIGGFDESLPALVDWECVLRLAQCGRFDFVDEPLVLQFLSDNSITNSRQRRARARDHILEKHAALFAGHPALMAEQYITVAGDCRQLGDIPAARAAIYKALRLQPFSRAVWMRAVFLTGLGLLRPRGRAS